MKVLIQHPKTHSYLRSDGRWTRDVEQAMDFRFSVQAATYGTTHLKKPFLIVFKFEQSEMDYTLHTYARHVPGQNSP